jgi:hypothetical protein
VAPPWRAASQGTPAILAYAKARSTRIGDRWSAPNVDAVIAAMGDAPRQVYHVGRPDHPPYVDGATLPYALGVADLAAVVLTLDRGIVNEWRFVRTVNRGLARAWIPGRIRWLWNVRTVLIARAVAHRLARIAESHPCAYVSDFYSAYMLGVTIAFRRAGRDVWDIQHGRIGPGHQAYNAEVFGIASHARPTGLVLWDAGTGAYVDEALGVPWTATQWAHLRLLGEQSATRRAGVLFTLQVDTPIPRGAIAAIRATSDVPWCLRLHPGGRNPEQDYLPLLDLDHVSLGEGTVSLAEALASVRVHVTWNSSVVLEAAVLGVPSLFMDAHACRDFAQVVASGVARHVAPEDLEAAVRRAVSSGDVGPSA